MGHSNHPSKVNWTLEAAVNHTQPDLRQYTARPIIDEGWRLRLLLPVGWVPNRVLDLGLAMFAGATAFAFRPRTRLPWLPKPLVDLLNPGREPHADLVLMCTKEAIPESLGGPELRSETSTRGGLPVYEAKIVKGFERACYSCLLMYSRTNRSEFESTFREIAESIELVN